MQLLLCFYFLILENYDKLTDRQTYRPTNQPMEMKVYGKFTRSILIYVYLETDNLVETLPGLHAAFIAAEANFGAAPAWHGRGNTLAAGLQKLGKSGM